MGEFVEAMGFIGEPTQQPGDPPLWPGGEAGARDAQREREARAQRGEFGRGFGFLGDAVFADDPAEELDRGRRARTQRCP